MGCHPETQLTIRQLAVFLKKANPCYEEEANTLLNLLNENVMLIKRQ
jgi:hypothetical protein